MTAAMRAELGPVVEALLNAARADAERVVAAADAEAAEQVAAARAEAAAILAQAGADGEAAATRAADAALAEARRVGRELILAAQRRVYEALQRGARETLARESRSSAVDALLARLEARARARLGPGAKVERLDDRIGVSATAGTRRVELTAERIVDGELAALSDRIAAVWR